MDYVIALYNYSFLYVNSHDHSGNVTALLNYRNEYWNFPHLYYKISTSSFNGEVRLDLMFIDTETFSRDDKQQKWLEEQLQQSKADHVIVAGHHPSFSPCRYGNDKALLRSLNPLLERYSATYFSGHEHCLSHIEENGVNYFINGIGVNCCYNDNFRSRVTSTPEVSIKYLFARSGFLNIKTGLNGTVSGFSSIIALKKELHVIFHNQNGDVLYETIVNSRNLVDIFNSEANIAADEL